MTRFAATTRQVVSFTMQTLTDFADLAVVLPLAICVAVWLVLSGWVAGGRLWLVAFGVLLAMTAILKLGFLGCAPSDSAILSPSGHTASSCFVYGGIATLSLRGRWQGAAAIGIAVAILVGISRVAVHAHSVSEVVLGGGVGVLALVGFFWKAGPAPPGLRPIWLILVCLPLMLFLHGARLNVEPHLRGLAFWFGQRVCRAVPWGVRVPASS
jgi:membrane-associated phospholipid phosphatase